MVYFVKGKYRACTIIMRERSRENYYDFETIIDCDPLKLYDIITKLYSNNHMLVTKIEIENIIKLS